VEDHSGKEGAIPNFQKNAPKSEDIDEIMHDEGI